MNYIYFNNTTILFCSIMFYTPGTIVLKVGRSIFLENVVVLAMKNMFSGVKKPL